MANPIVKYLYGIDEYYGDLGCCLTCYKPEKKEGCFCSDMKCKQCIFYVDKKYRPNYKQGSCGYAPLEVVGLDTWM